ncbi:predicted protein [Postia placenta Mad-698-R]|nr:predicted protein [Postia placenta Mad-698-R]
MCTSVWAKLLTILLAAMNWLAITGAIITVMPSLDDPVWNIPFTRSLSWFCASTVMGIVSSAISPLAALRVHALSGGTWYWVLPVWLLGMAPLGYNVAWLIIVKLESAGMNPVTFNTGVYAEFADFFDFNTLIDTYRMFVASTVSMVVSDILVVVATWYCISRTSSVRTQLVHDMWTAKPSLTTVMFRVDLAAYNSMLSPISKTTWIQEAKMMQETRAMME